MISDQESKDFSKALNEKIIQNEQLNNQIEKMKQDNLQEIKVTEELHNTKIKNIVDKLKECNLQTRTKYNKNKSRI